MSEFNGWDYCYYCKKKMTKEDKKDWDPKMCCNGNECGCMGMPTDPPCCLKCAKDE